MRANIAVVYCLLFIAIKHVSAQNGQYKAAVVEFAPETTPRPENIKNNLIRFLNIIETAHQQLVDLIVFPEIGLIGYGGRGSPPELTEVPDPRDKISPCDSTISSEILHELSCASRNNSIFLVVNLSEKEECADQEDCPDTGFKRYNTNVVFDRKGVVVARYRKYNLFGEFGVSVTEDPELAFFDTDFGVKFGIFTCFDIMFDQPALQLVKKLGIKDFVFPTAWFSELPFLTALQAQQMWAYTNNVSLLASGYRDLPVGSGGSGIHVGRSGLKTSTFEGGSNFELLVADVTPHEKKTENSDDSSPQVYLKRDHIDVYASKSLVDLEKDNELCFKDFCCTFEVKFDAPKEPGSTFRAVVFDGVRTFDNVASGGVQTCAIISCANDTLQGCGTRVNTQYVFSDIVIRGRFKNNHALPMPSTVLYNLNPVHPDSFKFDTDCDDETCNITMRLTKPVDNMLTFGIYSRDFSRDGQPPTSSNANSNGSLISMFGLLLIFNCFLKIT